MQITDLAEMKMKRTCNRKEKVYMQSSEGFFFWTVYEHFHG
jgi:hypothetical protein